LSTFILMKILESAPSRYDRGIKMITLGRLEKVYDKLTSHIRQGQLVLDIGCGTGALTLRAAEKGAKIKAIDVKPEMLQIAQKRAEEKGLQHLIEFAEMGVAELSQERDKSYDAIMSGLLFSELTEDEIRYTLSQAKRILKDNGLLLIADEIKPKQFVKRCIHFILRLPLVIVVFILTQTTTSAIRGLDERIRNAGFQIIDSATNWLGDFQSIVVVKNDKKVGEQ